VLLAWITWLLLVVVLELLGQTLAAVVVLVDSFRGRRMLLPLGIHLLLLLVLVVRRQEVMAAIQLFIL
jgi:hypothetical protein